MGLSLAPKRRSKFNAQRTEVDGITFDSKAEARRYSELALLVKAGVITDLACQPKWKLAINGKPILIKSLSTRKPRQATYRADFGYIEGGKQIYEDCKGYLTSESALRIGVVEAMTGGEIRLVRAVRK